MSGLTVCMFYFYYTKSCQCIWHDFTKGNKNPLWSFCFIVIHLSPILFMNGLFMYKVQPNTVLTYKHENVHEYVTMKKCITVL